jgi:hypothetical protein
MRPFWKRRHRYNREQVDTLGWPHPRPAKDPRLVCTNIALPWVSFVQIIAGPAPSSVQGQAFSFTAVVAFSVLMIVSSALVLYAAYCKSQYWSWGVELAGCIGFAFVFALYSLALVGTITDWYSTTSAAWAIALLAGNGWRAGQLAPRIW